MGALATSGEISMLSPPAADGLNEASPGRADVDLAQVVARGAHKRARLRFSMPPHTRPAVHRPGMMIVVIGDIALAVRRGGAHVRRICRD